MATFSFPATASRFSMRPGGGGTTPPPANSPDAGLLQGIVADIGSNKALAAANEANARAAATQAEGYEREIEAFQTVGAIARESATIEGISGNIKQLQAGRAVQRTVGRQRAETASAGFAEAGSSLDILRATLQEGYLQDQLIRSQTSITQGGFLEQSAAAEADAEGARLASDAALELSRSYTTAGQLATANAASETEALRAYLETTGGISDNSEPTRPMRSWYDQQYGLHIDFGSPGKGNTNAARALAAETLGLDIGESSQARDPFRLGG